MRKALLLFSFIFCLANRVSAIGVSTTTATALPPVNFAVSASTVSLSLSTPRISLSPVQLSSSSWAGAYNITVAISDASGAQILQASCSGSLRPEDNVQTIFSGNTQTATITCDYIGGSDTPVVVVSLDKSGHITISGDTIPSTVVYISP